MTMNKKRKEKKKENNSSSSSSTQNECCGGFYAYLDREETTFLCCCCCCRTAEMIQESFFTATCLISSLVQSDFYPSPFSVLSRGRPGFNSNPQLSHFLKISIV